MSNEIKHPGNSRVQLAQLVQHAALAQATTQVVGSHSHVIRPHESAFLKSPFLDLHHLTLVPKVPAPDKPTAPPPPPPPPPPRHLDQIQIDTGTIVFSAGVPVGGTRI
jgi:hypothetical protein